MATVNVFPEPLTPRKRITPGLFFRISSKSIFLFKTSNISSLKLSIIISLASPLATFLPSSFAFTLFFKSSTTSKHTFASSKASSISKNNSSSFLASSSLNPDTASKNFFLKKENITSAVFSPIQVLFSPIRLASLQFPFGCFPLPYLNHLFYSQHISRRPQHFS